MKVLLEDEVSWEEIDTLKDCPSITPYLLKDKPNAPIILVIPGGGYLHRAYHEGEPVAKWLNDNGMHACVLRYQVTPIKDQETIQQGQSALLLIKKELVKWGLSVNCKIGVLGFSAGGHLAAIISNRYIENGTTSSRPDFHILCYPVISMGEHTHEGSKQNLLGEDPSNALIHHYSAELTVHQHTPTAFIWTTANDKAVNAINSLKYCTALQQFNISYELHMYQDGRHGLGLANEHEHVQNWKQACINWLKRYVGKKEEIL